MLLYLHSLALISLTPPFPLQKIPNFHTTLFPKWHFQLDQPLSSFPSLDALSGWLKLESARMSADVRELFLESTTSVSASSALSDCAIEVFPDSVAAGTELHSSDGPWPGLILAGPNGNQKRDQWFYIKFERRHSRARDGKFFLRFVNRRINSKSLRLYGFKLEETIKQAYCTKYTSPAFFSNP